MSHIPRVDWHSAFVSGLKIELEEYQDILEFQPEYALNSGPRRIDCLVTKAPGSPPISSPIGNYFRQYNLFDYKGPEDTMSVQNYYKVLSYVYSLPEYLAASDILEHLTVTLVSHSFPRKLINFLEQKELKALEKIIPGLYNISNREFPMRLVILPQLPKEEYLWLHSLTNHLTAATPVADLRQAYARHKDDPDYQNFLTNFIRANLAAKGSEELMCEGLYELFHDELIARESRGEARGREQGLISGTQRMSRLILKLNSENRNDDILKAASDAKYCNSLLKQYNL